MLFVLNTPVLTTYGIFKFAPISVEEAKTLLRGGFQSAVGHSATAEVMSRILGVQIPMDRGQIFMQPGDRAIVFRLLTRLPEGRVLSREELEALPYELGLLTRLD